MKRGMGIGIIGATAVMLVLAASGTARAAPNSQVIHAINLTCAQLSPGSTPVTPINPVITAGTQIARSANQAYEIEYVVVPAQVSDNVVTKPAEIASWRIVKPVTPPAINPGVRVAYVRYVVNNKLVAVGNYYAPDNGIADLDAGLTTTGARSINTLAFCLNDFIVPNSGPTACPANLCVEGQPPYFLTVQGIDEPLYQNCGCNWETVDKESVGCDPTGTSTAAEYPPCGDDTLSSIVDSFTSTGQGPGSVACATRTTDNDGASEVTLTCLKGVPPEEPSSVE